MIKKLFNIQISLGLIFASALSLAFTNNAGAATVDVTCENLPAAIVGASAGDTINVTGDCTLLTNTVINKQLTINGVDTPKIATSGTTQIFTITAPGANTVIRGFTFDKTDTTGPQNIIGVQANNVTLTNNTYLGKYITGAPEVSRAIEVSGAVTGLTIANSSFKNLRQPAYINDNATGTIQKNYVDISRGFVLVANTDFKFTENSWGNNFLDIAIIPGAPNNYSCEDVLQIRRDNNNAKVQNQAQTPACPTYPVTVEECKNNGYKNFNGQQFKNQGDCVSYVASQGKAGGSENANQNSSQTNQGIGDKIQNFITNLF